MKPSEVRKRILDDHAHLRVRLADVEVSARAVEAGDAGQALRLRALAEGLRGRLVEHLDLEDAVLVPAVRAADGWGDERARHIVEEHAEQRAELDRLLEELGDPGVPTERLARDILALVQAFRVDMDQEEQAVLQADLLRDDVTRSDLQIG